MKNTTKIVPALLVALGLTTGVSNAMPVHLNTANASLFQVTEVSSQGTLVADGHETGSEAKPAGAETKEHAFAKDKCGTDKCSGENKCSADKCSADKCSADTEKEGAAKTEGATQESDTEE